MLRERFALDIYNGTDSTNPDMVIKQLEVVAQSDY
jgi:hypothetical protein